MEGTSLIIARSQAKQNMRDAFRRLRRIRFSCGDKDFADGDDDRIDRDPLLSCISRFEQRVEEAQFLLGGDDLTDSDRLTVRRACLGATVELRALEEMLEKADALYNTALLKKKSAEKLQTLGEQRDRCKRAFDTAHETHTELQRMQSDRAAIELAAAEQLKAKRAKAGGQGAGGAAADDTLRREPIAPTDGGRAEQRSMRRAIDILARAHGMLEDDAAAAQQHDTDIYANAGVTLEQDASTRQQAGVIREQKKQVQAALTRISQGVMKLHEMSKLMATEIEVQSRRVENLANVVEAKQQSIQDVNKRLEQLHESLQPLNALFNVCCFVLLLALVGFLLTYYKVVNIGL